VYATISRAGATPTTKSTQSMTWDTRRGRAGSVIATAHATAIVATVACGLASRYVKPAYANGTVMRFA
jgi:hypothetical protein